MGPNSTIALTIQIDGGFFQLLDYLNRLEDLERLVIVDTINITSNSGTSSTGSGSTSGASSSSGSTTGGPPDLSVTLTGRMFTTAAAPASTGSGSTGHTVHAVHARRDDGDHAERGLDVEHRPHRPPPAPDRSS